jgi:outer membrane immunogenic protein
MNMMKTALFALALSASAIASTSAAQAADPIDPMYDWSGLYVGLQAGYAFGDADHSFNNGAPSDSSDPDGFFGGLHVGYNHQMQSVLFGLEMDAELADINGNFDNTTGIGSSGSTDINAQGSLRLRLGLPMDRALPYLTGGLAIADVDYGGGPSGGPCCGYSKTPLGFTVGAGFEYAWSDTMTSRIEYRYTDFGKENSGLDPTFSTVDMPVDLQTHALRVGLSWQF